MRSRQLLIYNSILFSQAFNGPRQALNGTASKLLVWEINQIKWAMYLKILSELLAKF